MNAGQKEEETYTNLLLVTISQLNKRATEQRSFRAFHSLFFALKLVRMNVRLIAVVVLNKVPLMMRFELEFVSCSFSLHPNNVRQRGEATKKEQGYFCKRRKKLNTVMVPVCIDAVQLPLARCRGRRGGFRRLVVSGGCFGRCR
jgi:hypothetical protein